MCPFHRLDTLRRGDDTGQRNIFCPALLHDREGARCGAAGGKHGVDHNGARIFQRRQLAVITPRHSSLVVALKPDIADRDIGKDILKRLQHSETRAKDWNHHQRAGQHSTDRRHERRVDGFLDRFQIARRLQREQQSELVTQIPKKHRLRRFIAQVGDDVLGQRVA